VRMGSKCEIFRFFKSGYDRNISIFRRRASRVTGNTLIKPDYASVRQSVEGFATPWHAQRDKKSRGGAVLWNRLSLKGEKCTEACFLAYYYACKFGVNRLRIDGDIREKPR